MFSKSSGSTDLPRKIFVSDRFWIILQRIQRFNIIMEQFYRQLQKKYFF